MGIDISIYCGFGLVNHRREERGQEMRYEVCGSFENPKRAKQYARFSAIASTIEEAENKAREWESQGRYTYIWIEEGKR